MKLDEIIEKLSLHDDKTDEEVVEAIHKLPIWEQKDLRLEIKQHLKEQKTKYVQGEISAKTIQKDVELMDFLKIILKA